jgi:class 3 adenylate cyclase
MSRSALEGERKQVTVLFADVKGSMDLAEQVDPEEWHKIMDRFFAILSEGVHRFEGTVNQYTGDGIMALFGALSPTRIMRSVLVTRRSTFNRGSAAMRTSFASSAASTSPSEWVSTRGRSWSGR